MNSSPIYRALDASRCLWPLETRHRSLLGTAFAALVLGAFLVMPTPARAQSGDALDDRWRVEVSQSTQKRGAVGVRIERRISKRLAVGVGRTEWGGLLGAVEAGLGERTVRPHVVGGVATVAGSGVVPFVGVGVDLALVPVLGLGLSVEQSTGGDAPRTVLRASLQARAGRLAPAAERLFPDSTRRAASHHQVSVSGGLVGARASAVGGRRDYEFVGGSVLWERSGGGRVAFGGAVEAGVEFTIGDGGPCEVSECGQAYVTAAPTVSLSPRGRYGTAWARAGVGAIVARVPGDLDVAPAVVGGAGLDVFPVATLGVGLGVTAAASAPLSTVGVQVGVRVRVPR